MAETANIARIAASLRPTLNTASCYNLTSTAVSNPILRFRPTTSPAAIPHLRRLRAQPPRPRAMTSSSSSSSPLEDSVKKTLADNPVVVYSKSWCPYSMEVKAFFEKIGVKPFIVELDELGSEGAQLQSTLARMTGQTTVPNVFIGGKHIGGCTDTVSLHQKGELASLLSGLNIETKNT